MTRATTTATPAASAARAPPLAGQRELGRARTALAAGGVAASRSRGSAVAGLAGRGAAPPAPAAPARAPAPARRLAAAAGSGRRSGAGIEGAGIPSASSWAAAAFARSWTSAALDPHQGGEVVVAAAPRCASSRSIAFWSSLSSIPARNPTRRRRRGGRSRRRGRESLISAPVGFAAMADDPRGLRLPLRRADRHRVARRRSRPRAGPDRAARRAAPAGRAPARRRDVEPGREHLLARDGAGRDARGDDGDGPVDQRQLHPPDHRGRRRSQGQGPPPRPHHLGLGRRSPRRRGQALRPGPDDDRRPAAARRANRRSGS